MQKGLKHDVKGLWLVLRAMLLVIKVFSSISNITGMLYCS